VTATAVAVTKVILWRHGNTDWNNERRYQGQTDVPLNDRGRAQAVTAAAKLALVKPDLILTSDLSRAADTASALSSLCGFTPQLDVRLRERSFGPFEGFTRDEVVERFPDIFRRWQQGETQPEDGLELLSDLGKRVTEVIRHAAEQVPGGTAVLVTHGASVKWGMAALLGWPEEVTQTIRPLDNCHWSELLLEDADRWVLARHNFGV
jgi:broad specificity phosphatase PhoE